MALRPSPTQPVFFSVTILALLLVFSGWVPLPPGPAAGRGQQGDEATGDGVFLCPPCGESCHFTTYSKAGICGACGMGLVPLASVPQVGVLLHTNSTPSSALLPISLFAGSDTARTFTVADTDEPLRLGDAVEIRPQFSFGEAPALDVLVVPDGYGAWDDELLVDWVRGAAEGARFVLVVGSGSLILARAGFLEGERVPVPHSLVQRGKELAPELVFEAETSWRRVDKFFLARDPEAALDACLAIVAELGGDVRAKRAADRFGRAWPLESDRTK